MVRPRESRCSPTPGTRPTESIALRAAINMPVTPSAATTAVIASKLGSRRDFDTDQRGNVADKHGHEGSGAPPQVSGAPSHRGASMPSAALAEVDDVAGVEGWVIAHSSSTTSRPSRAHRSPVPRRAGRAARRAPIGRAWPGRAVQVGDVGRQLVVRAEHRIEHVERVEAVAELGAHRRVPNRRSARCRRRRTASRVPPAWASTPASFAVDQQIVRPLQRRRHPGDRRCTPAPPPERPAGSARADGRARRGTAATPTGWRPVVRPIAGRGDPARCLVRGHQHAAIGRACRGRGQQVGVRAAGFVDDQSISQCGTGVSIEQDCHSC